MSKIKLLITLLIAVACSITIPVSPTYAQSQATSGEIVGTVRDPQGAVVPGATITVTNPANNLTQTLTTNDNGNFRASNLQPGLYTITINATGFGEYTQTGYQVEVGSSLDALIDLQTGAVNEEVTVTAASVATTEIQTPTVINQTAISELPINGRRFQDFVTLTPTADIDPQRGAISLAGQRGINTNVQIDGADYNNPFFGGLRGGERSNSAFTFPQSGIREFQVVTSGFNAEFGRSTGGIVNAVTKSGTNDFSGTVFYLNRPARSAARNAFGQEAAPTQQQFGGGVGGPFLNFGEGGPVFARDKAFFFLSYEQQILNQDRLVLFDRLGQVPSTAVGVSEAFNFYRGLETPFVQTNDASAFLGRLDYIFSERNTFNVRYNYSINNAANAVSTGNALQPATNSALSNNGTEGNSQHTTVGQLTSFFSPTVINEFRGQYSRENRPRTPNNIQALISNTFGNVGTRTFLPTTQYDYRVQLADNLTSNVGNHSLKFGVDYNYAFADQLFAFRQTGDFNFTNSDVSRVLQVLSVGSAAANDPANRFDDSIVRYTRNVGNGLAQISSTEIAGYAQDSWRIRPNFTLYYGLRYEAQLFSQPETTNTTLTNLVANTVFPLNGTVNPTAIADQTNQFAPRVGFAYDPFGDSKTVIRGYSGIYYARTPLLTIAGPINNFRAIPGDVSLTLNPLTDTVVNGVVTRTACANGIRASDPRCPSTIYRQFQSIGINLNQFALDNLPILTREQVLQIQANVSAATGSPLNPNAGLNLITAGDELRNPRSTQFGFGIEREIARAFTIGATFDYVNTANLNRNRDYNLAVPTVRANDLSLRPVYNFSQRPIPSLGYVQVRESSARSLYRALTLRAQMRRRAFQFDTFYTFSRNLDDDSTERQATFSEYNDSSNLTPEYNFSRLDRTHQFVFNTVYRAPFGFQLSATGRLRSAAPLDVTTSSIIAPAGSSLTNAQYAAQVTVSGSLSGDLNSDRGNFADRPFVAPGEPLLRNSFRNRPFYDVGLRLQRDFRFGERARLSPSIEAFNVFNFENILLAGTTATNYGNPGVNERTGEVLQASNPNFLRLRNANGNFLLNNQPGAPRQLQFGLRFEF